MGAPLLLAIDNGSQSTKVHVIDRHGQVLTSATTPLAPYQMPAPGRVVHPADDLWTTIAATTRTALERLGADRRDVVGVGLCTIRFCRVLLDRQGRLVEPVLSWMDERVSRPHVADDRVAFVTTSSGYITHRLTGQRRDAAANYQGVWPIDQVSAQWSTDPQAHLATGMPREMLFDLVEPGGRLGVVTESASRATGLEVGTPVFATANDKAVEAIGAGIDSDTVLLSLGTYIAAMAVGSEATGGSDAYWVNFGATPRSYLYESNGIRRGMWTVSWARDLLAPGGSAALGSRTAEEVLCDEAALVAPGSGGVMTVLDFLAPVDSPFRRGALLGFDGTQGRAHIFRSVLEAITVAMADNIEAMEAALGRSFTSVLVTGGGAKADLIMQLTADMLGRPTRRAGFSDAAGLGAAICAAVGVGLHEDFPTAVRAMVRPGPAFQPDPGLAATYQELRERYRRLRPALDPLFKHLSGPLPSGGASSR